MRKLCFLLLIAALMFFAFAHEGRRFEYVQELARDVYVNWWENDVLVATGRGVSPENTGSYESAKIFARRAAVMDAYRNLAVQAGSIRITRDEKMSQSEVRALLNGAEIVSEDYDERGNCTVVAKIPIYGVTNSVAKFAFKPVARENFLPPSESVTTEGNYTGLIIDCGDAELNPVLSPTVRNEKNQSVYSYRNLEYEKVIAAGMIGYERKASDSSILLSKSIFSVADAAGANRAGNNPLVVKAVYMGDDNTCPVISAEDSDKILAENGISHFLDNGAVVFTSNRIRGMRM